MINEELSTIYINNTTSDEIIYHFKVEKTGFYEVYFHGETITLPNTTIPDNNFQNVPLTIINIITDNKEVSEPLIGDCNVKETFFLKTNEIIKITKSDGTISYNLVIKFV